jgi:hypothetical protein
MDRRRALVTIGLAAFSGVAWSLTRPRLPSATLTQVSLPASGTASNQALDDRLRRDLARRSQRINSEEGIAMFLACENLVTDKSSREPAKVTLTPTNTAFASAFERNAEAWQRIHPDAQYKDVAQIIEVMAYRDFTNGETAEGQ